MMFRSSARLAIRLGVIGCGRVTMVHHLPALARLEGFHVEAIADTNPERLKEAACRFGVRHRFTDFHDLLGHPGVEAVLVATPTPSHAEIGIAALGQGKHAVLEKPLALSVEECDRLIEERDRSSRKALVALNSRWHRIVIQARRLIYEGVLGEPRGIRSTYTHWHPGESAQAWHKRRSLGGGVLFNDGVHHFDLWRHLLGTEVREIGALSMSSEHFDDDTCVATARLENGGLASAFFSFSTSANSELEIFGDGGRMLLSLYKFDGLEFHPSTSLPGSLGTRFGLAGKSLRALPAAVGEWKRGGAFASTYESLWRHFESCVREDAPPGCSLEDGKRAVEISLAASRSVESGSIVRLPVRGALSLEGSPDPLS